MDSQIGIRQLRDEASRIIERVEAGEIVTVTKRGRTVARIVPATMPPGLARLVATGRMRWTGQKPEFPTPVKLRGTGRTAAEYVADGRR